MRAQPVSLHDHPAGIDASVKKPLGIPYRIGAWILHEWLKILPPTIFFFVGFNFIVLTTNLLVAQYLVAVSNFMLATLAALVPEVFHVPRPGASAHHRDPRPANLPREPGCGICRAPRRPGI